MSAFRVGQRVRIVSAVNHPEWIGQEAIVTGVNVPAYGGPKLAPYVGTGINRVNKWGNPVVCRDWEIEPIQPQGATPSEFKTLADLLASLEVTA